MSQLTERKKMINRISERIEKEIGLKPESVHFGLIPATINEPGEPDNEEIVELMISYNKWDFPLSDHQVDRVIEISKEEGVLKYATEIKVF